MSDLVSGNLVERIAGAWLEVDALSEEWERLRPDAESFTLEDLVSILASLRAVSGPLALIDSDLSAIIYDRTWAEYGTHSAKVLDHSVEVAQSKSVSTDGARLVSAIAARLGDEMASAGIRMLDPETGDLVPPAETVRQIVERVADLAGLRNASQSWAKSRLKPLGLDLDQFQETSSRAAKRVKLG